MSSMKGYTQYVGPTAALAGGGAGSTWTYTHPQGKAAKKIDILNALGQAVPPTVCGVTVNSATTVAIQAGATGAGAYTVRIEWEEYQPMAAAAISGIGTAFVVS